MYRRTFEEERKNLLRRWSELDTEFSSWMYQGQEISRYILPVAGRFMETDRNRGNKRYNNILDSTGTRALRILGAGLMGGATSPARPWFRLATPDPELMKYASVKIWLDQSTKLMLDVFERSNTYRALHMIYEEIGAFGTAACLVLDDFQDVIRLYPLTYGEYRLAASYRGEINTLARKFQMTVSTLVTEFGRENCSDAVKSMYDSGTLDAWITVYHFIEPRSDRDPSRKDALNMEWRSIYFEEGGCTDKFLREGGFKRFRVLAPRWSLSGGDIYGTGPGAEALGAIKQLQHEQRRKAEAIDYKTRPPLQAPDSMKNRVIDTLPGGSTYADFSTSGGGIRTLFEVNLDLQHLLLDVQDVRNRINDTFSVPIFLMMANDNRSNVTATEIAERHEEKLMMMGPTLERLHNELLSPLIEITFDRLLETGVLPIPPEELQGIDLKVEFVSMLAQAQRAITTTSTDRYVIGLMNVAQGKPEVLDKFDEDAWADDYADALGINPKLVRDEETVIQIRQMRAQAQQQAQQQAAMAQAAETAKTLSSASTATPNALTDITNSFSGYA